MIFDLPLLGQIEEVLLEGFAWSSQMLGDVFGHYSLLADRPFKCDNNRYSEVPQEAGEVFQVALHLRPSAGLQLGQEEILDINDYACAVIGTYALCHEQRAPLN